MQFSPRLSLAVATCFLSTLGSPAFAQVTLEGQRRPLTLTEAREILHTENLNLELSQTAVDRAQLIEERASTLFVPSLDLTAIYTLRDKEIEFESSSPFAPLEPYLDSVYNSDPGIQQFYDDNPDSVDPRLLAGQDFPPSIVQQRHDVRAILTLTQPIFSYQAIAVLNLSELSVEQAEHSQEELLFELDKSLLQLYFNALNSKKSISVASHNVEVSITHLAQVQAALEEGVGLLFEVTRAEVAVKNAEQDLLSAQLSYDLALDSLATLLEIDADFDVVEPDEISVNKDTATLIESALDDRPETLNSSCTLRSLDLQEDRIDGGYVPVVYAQGQTVFQQETAFGGEAVSWSVSLNLQWSIFDGFQREVEREQLAFDRSQVTLRQELIEQNITSEVRQANLVLQSEELNAESAQLELTLALQNEALTQEAYDLGVSTLIDLELARQQRYLSELGAANAQVRVLAQTYLIQHLSMQPW